MSITLKNVRKEYGRVVLDGVSHTFEGGRLYVVKGVSGCGKSTLLNILGGVEKDFSGEIIRDGAEWPGVGYIFQKSLLISKLTVRENLALISGDGERIGALAGALGIGALLDKYPERLSGGERQRAAVLRALLTDPGLLLADEPTASLDEGNSRKIAALLAGLRREDRIVIVATHEDCFDPYADEILCLNYGTLESAGTRESVPRETPAPPYVKAAPPKLRPFRYALKRDPKLLRPGSGVALTLAFLLVLLVCALQTNFKREALFFLQSRRPMDLVVYYHTQMGDFPFEGLKRYENYTLAEDGVKAYALLDKKDSVFSLRGMIEYGDFPGGPTEAIVSREFVRYRFGEDFPLPEAVGRTFCLAGETFRIAGVAGDLGSRGVQLNLVAHPYYQRRTVENAVFIPYGTMERIGAPEESEFRVAVYDGLPASGEVLQYIVEQIGGLPNQFYREIEEKQYEVDRLAGIAFTVLGVSFAASCVFMITMVHTDLFARKRELGYLQIFGVSRFRVFRMVMAGYVLKIAAPVVLAAAVFALALLAYGAAVGRMPLVDLSLSAGLISILVLLYLTSAALSALAFLRKSAISLIA